MIKLYVWPNGSWIKANAYDEIKYAWMGDDYKIITISMLLSNSDIDRYLDERITDIF